MTRTLYTFADLKEYADAFANGDINLLIISGSAGTSKSTIMKNALGDACLYLEGTVTAFQLYRALYSAIDSPVVLDDVDGIYKDQGAVRLLKLLCQTESTKTVQWNSASRQLDADGIPRSFTTASRVCLIANDWVALNKNVEAVVDRGQHVRFEPSAEEVHRYAGQFVSDREVYEYIGGLLPYIVKPSLRNYVGASELKRGGLDWRRSLAETFGCEPALVAMMEILSDTSFATVNDRVAAFKRTTGSSRSTYFRLKKEVENNSRKRLVL